jgi:hypothetical protein
MVVETEFGAIIHRDAFAGFFWQWGEQLVLGEESVTG